MKTFRQHLPTWLKRFLRIGAYWLGDTWNGLIGRHEPMVPPRMTSLVHGSGDFKKAGKEFLDYFVRYANLAPDHHVLEIGAGYGRMAVGLTDFLVPPGSYDGIEIIDKAVGWCTREISTRYPNFRFHHADICNRYSNPNGKMSATDYRLPFADGTFDLVFLAAVFTNMLPKDIDAYLAEISRVLKPDGRCFITYFLLDDFALKQIGDRRASQPFYHSFDGYLSTSHDTPENTVAVPEGTVLEWYARHGLRIDEPILYGSWAGREHCLTYQDAIIARKPVTR